MSESPLHSRLLAETVEPLSEPEAIWRKIETRVAKRREKRRVVSLVAGSGIALGAVVAYSVFSLRPSTLSVWRLDERRILQVGERLETKQSPATLTSVGIGTVSLGPRSRLRVLESVPRGPQRFALEAGSLVAKVSTPPRILVVETPTATATDMGCEYRLSVIPELSASDSSRVARKPPTSSLLTVLSGYVEMQDRTGQVVLVPAGASIKVQPDGHQTLPWHGARLRAVLAYDRTRQLSPLLKALTEPLDTLILFHLLTRVEREERARVLEKLLTFVSLPGQVTREQVLALDKQALATWREELKLLWGGPPLGI